MDYIIAKQAAQKWGCSLRSVQEYCEAGRIPGAMKPSRDWLIPADAEKPPDARVKHGKYIGIDTNRKRRKEGNENE
ncbi:MAG: helix-turn-helix domain-containing protein [Oscillospiraceae bacterium]|nr:helix-turn-helix domain-containing protein [Oscillospiraceae bacterium]